MKNTQVLVDYSLSYFVCPEGICRFPGCTSTATHVIADGRYASTDYRCKTEPVEAPLVCADHYCTCSVHKRELYGIGGFSLIPDITDDLGIAWKALIKFCYCAVCGKLAYPYRGEGVGSGGLQVAYEIISRRFEINENHSDYESTARYKAYSRPHMAVYEGLNPYAKRPKKSEDTFVSRRFTPEESEAYHNELAKQAGMSREKLGQELFRLFYDVDPEAL